MDTYLYDEFDNYISPELQSDDDSDDASEEEEEEDYDLQGNEERMKQNETEIEESSAVVLHEEDDFEEDGPPAMQILTAQTANVVLEDQITGDEIMKEQWMKNLQIDLKRYHLVPLAMDMAVDDGNSFFRAVSIFLAGNETRHMAVRLNAVQTLVTNYEQFYKQFFYDRSFEEYKHEMLKSGTYADEAMIFATAECFKIVIIVVYSDQKKTYQRTKESHTMKEINLGCIDQRHYIAASIYKGNHMCFLISNKKKQVSQVCKQVKTVFEGNLGFQFSPFVFSNSDDLSAHLKKSSCERYDSIFVFIIPSTNECVFPTVAKILEKHFVSTKDGEKLPKIFIEWNIGNGKMESGSCDPLSQIYRIKLTTKKDKEDIGFHFVKDINDALSKSNSVSINELTKQIVDKYNEIDDCLLTCCGNLSGQYEIGSMLSHRCTEDVDNESDEAMSEINQQPSTQTSEDVNIVMN